MGKDIVKIAIFPVCNFVHCCGLTFKSDRKVPI